MHENVKWATIIPLIGGSAIGCAQTIGHKPEYHLSFNGFQNNEQHILNYWKDVPMHRIDDPDFKASDLPDVKIDVVNSVCPCAGLSGLSHTSNADSAVNEWLYKSSEFVLNTVKPKVLWGENAPALSTTKGRKVALKLAEIGRKYGYSYSMIKTNAMEHGLPQNRQRTFYFFWQSAMSPIIGYHNTKMTDFVTYINQVKDDELHQDMLSNSSNIENSLEYQFINETLGLDYYSIQQKFKRGSLGSIIVYKIGSQKYIDWLNEKPQTKIRDCNIKKYKHIIEKLSIGKGYMDFSPIYATEYTNAMVGHKMYETIHPTKKRFLSVRELMHMMGLPSDFELCGGRNNINHIAQNVPTPTTRDFMKEVLRFVECDTTLLKAPANFCSTR